MINDDKKIDPQQTHPRSSLANAPNPTSHLEQIANHSGENKLPAPDLSATDLSNTNQQQTVSSSTQQGLANNLSTNLANHQTDTGNGGYLELLEERPVINKERLDVGKVTVTKHRRTKTIEVPIELVEEYITVRTDYQDVQSQDLLSGDYDDKDILRHVEPSLDSKAVVTINGKQVEIGDAPIEIILSRQVATITKDTHVIQEIEINKTTHTHTDSIQVALQHEELDVKEEGYLAHEQQSNAADKK
ncbi:MULTISPECIES: YsnF/AvaK domain-containing protein [Psychrobacter]|uniref:YsnF/AvaK domain-containing protein n=1 Tax=Psychrobacter TaxID=497 RepID=UPI0018DF553A|nr:MULTISPECIES: YsnF/AvaK domain-containing protein [Psychrobacter]WLW66644.1 YsnF/AvaK domain-containing protein [Psychrobacter sp. van23A]